MQWIITGRRLVGLDWGTKGRFGAMRTVNDILVLHYVKFICLLNASLPQITPDPILVRDLLSNFEVH